MLINPQTHCFAPKWPPETALWQTARAFTLTSPQSGTAELNRRSPPLRPPGRLCFLLWMKELPHSFPAGSEVSLPPPPRLSHAERLPLTPSLPAGVKLPRYPRSPVTRPGPETSTGQETSVGPETSVEQRRGAETRGESKFRRWAQWGERGGKGIKTHATTEQDKKQSQH